MSENFTEKEMNILGKYIQKKERRMAALTNAIQSMGGSGTIYGSELNDMLVVVYEDKMPGSLNLQKSMPDLYPPLKKPKEEKEKSDEEPDQD